MALASHMSLLKTATEQRNAGEGLEAKGRLDKGHPILDRFFCLPLMYFHSLFWHRLPLNSEQLGDTSPQDKRAPSSFDHVNDC